jgi:hypothetical protein
LVTVNRERRFLSPFGTDLISTRANYGNVVADARGMTMTRRFTRFLCVAAAVAAVMSPCFSFATRPFGNTGIRKEKGQWVCPSHFTRDLVVFLSADDRRVIALKTLFPGKDYDLNVSMTTAGPLWGQASLYYIVMLGQTDFFTMHTSAGKRLLVNLTTAAVEKVGDRAEDLMKADQKEIRATLAEVCRRLTPPGEGYDEEKLHGAMLLAAKYKMIDVGPQLEIIEKSGWHGGFTLEYEDCSDRRFAQLAMRRLALAPKGYPTIVFTGDPKGRVISSQERRRTVGNLKPGLSEGEVRQLIGPPDYFASAFWEEKNVGSAYWNRKWPNDAWRYDFDGPSDFSLLVIWGPSGIDHIEKVTPALWRGDVLFSSEMPKPVFGADGGVNGIHLYTEAFRGKIENLSTPGTPHEPSRE